MEKHNGFAPVKRLFLVIVLPLLLVLPLTSLLAPAPPVSALTEEEIAACLALNGKTGYATNSTFKKCQEAGYCKLGAQQPSGPNLERWEFVCSEPSGEGGGSGSDEEELESTCTIEGGLGYIFCPLLNTAGGLVDGVWDTILENLLVVPPLLTDRDSGLYRGWAVMRNIANILFVLAFIYIIFSQVTSVGISNYGIKKMLPRLIMGAILVNTSFYLAAAAIDLSNVVGTGAYSIMDGIAGEVNNPPSDSEEAGSADGPPTSWMSAVYTAITAASLVVMIYLGLLLPLITASIILVLGLLLTLAFRHAVILMLVVVAPIAAVAYMMPNTDKISRSWWGLFKILLLLFPLIGFVIGAGKLASVVIFEVAQSAGGYTAFMLGIMALLARVIGVLAIPLLLKATGGALNRIGVNPLNGARNKAMSAVNKRADRVRADNRNRLHAQAMQFSRGDGKPGRFRRAVGRTFGHGSHVAQRSAELEAAAKAEDTRYEESNEQLRESAKKTRDSRIVTSAAEGASKQGDLEEFANADDAKLRELAGGSDEMLDVLKSQQEAAVAQAAQGLASKYAAMDFAGLREALEESSNKGDRVATQAIGKELATGRGSAGIKQLEAHYKKMDKDIVTSGLAERYATNPNDLTADEAKAVRGYKQLNQTVVSSDAKSRSVALYTHAQKGGALATVPDPNNPTKTLPSSIDIQATVGNYTNLSPNQLATQGGQAFTNAVDRFESDSDFRSAIQRVVNNPTAYANASEDFQKAAIQYGFVSNDGKPVDTTPPARPTSASTASQGELKIDRSASPPADTSGSEE